MLYVAETLVTAVAETIVRDRFVGKVRRRLTEDEVEDWGVLEVEAAVPLRPLDLRESGTLVLGLPTNVVRGKAQSPGQRFSERLYRLMPGADGIIYRSRQTNDVRIAVYDRAVTKLSASPVYPVIRHAGVVPALRALNVTVLAK